MRLHGNLLLSLLFAVTACLLDAQGYETKFKATGFKLGDVYHTDEHVNVSLTGGGLEVEIPLGPALPGPIPIRPVVHYHGKYSQPLNPYWNYGQALHDGFIGPFTPGNQIDAIEKAYKRWSPPTLPSAEAHPGYLTFRAGSTAIRSLSEPDVTLHSPFGKTTSYYLGMPGAYTYLSSSPRDVSELDTLANTMAPEWDRTTTPISGPGCTVLPGTPTSLSLGMAVGVRLSGGTTLVFGPSVDRIFRRWTASYNPITSDLLLVPREILQVDQDFVTLWRRSRNVYQMDWNPKDVNGTLADYRWNQSIYHPVWIKTRSGFRADITVYRNPPGGHNGCLSDGGILTGYRVSINNGETWFQVGHASDDLSGPNVTFGGMDAATFEGGRFSGLTPSRPRDPGGKDPGDFQPGTTLGYEDLGLSAFHWELEYASASLEFMTDHLTYGGLTTLFEWNGPQGQLTKLTTPSGKTYSFTYQLVQGVGTNPRSSVDGLSWLWTSTTPGALDFYSTVTRMDIQENALGSAQGRNTTYRWKLPQVDPLSPPGTIRWTSPSQGVAQTLPSGETILHVFSSPLNGAAVPDSLELEGRTFLAARQAVVARYHYPSGDTSWESFIDRGADPAASAWYARERFEGWDLRSWESRIREPRGANPLHLSSNTEPRPTRSIKEEKDGPVEVTEWDDWNPDLGNYAVKRTYVLPPGRSPNAQFWAPGSMQGLNAPLTPGDTSYTRRPGLTELSPAGVLAHQVTLTAYASDPTAALLDRELRVETKVLLAPATGATGFLNRTQKTYGDGARAHVVLQTDQLDLQGGSSALSLKFDQRPLGLYKVNQLREVTLDSTMPTTALNGLAGATYEYDPTGRFMTSIQPKGVTWSEQEPDHDNMGRPLAHTDPNGFTARYTWDLLGRLTGMTPAQPETGTVITPENSLRKITLTRGSQTKVYHYNGFGELTGEERTGPGGQVSHRIHGYDVGGRKIFESTWRNGPVSDLQAWARPVPGGNGLTTWVFDDRGRIVKTVNANEDVTDTRYITPLRTELSTYPDIDGIRTAAITTLDKDVLGRLARVTDAAGQQTSYAYDAAGHIRQVQQRDQIRTWSYDLFGRLDSLTQPESGVTKYSGYTVTGKPTQTTYGYGGPNPRTVVTSYDALSRPIRITSLDASVDQAFVYDGAPAGGRTTFGCALGQLTYSRDQDVELWYGYAGLNGRLSELDTRIGPGGNASAAAQSFAQAFGYALDGMRISASVDGRTQRLSLEDASRLPLSVTHSNLRDQTITVANFTQDPLLWSPTRIEFGNGAHTLLGYRADQTGLASMSHTLSGEAAPRLSWTYTYDGSGRLMSDGQDVYQYDLLGRLSLAHIQRPGSPQTLTQRFTYDSVGNLLSSLTTPNVGTLPAALVNFAFPATATELSQRNQLPLAQTGAQYDSQGNLTYLWKTPSPSGPFIRMTYDALGRVSTLYDSASGFKEAYAYTAEGLRTRIDTFDGATPRKTRYRIYNDQRQLVSEYEVVRSEATPKSLTLPSTKTPRPRAVRKNSLLLAEKKDRKPLRNAKSLPIIRYRNNDGTFPNPTPSLIDNNGPAGAYITYPIGDITIPLGTKASFTGTTDYGTDFAWDFGDGTPTVSGSFGAPVRGTTRIDHTFNSLSSPTFTVRFTTRNTPGGYTLSVATLQVTVVPASLPVIEAFTANGLRDTATVYWGDPASLGWKVTGATSLTLGPGIGPVSPLDQGSWDVSDLQITTDYTLTATNSAGSVTQGVRIRVLPKIQAFSADANPIDAGSTSNLAWNVAGATLISLQEGGHLPWDVTGTASRPVSPLAPTEYALWASNEDGTSPASVLQLNVVPVISRFEATPSSILPGQTSLLFWNVLGSDLNLSLDQGIGPVTGDNQSVAPPSTTAYTLTARNSYTSVSRSAVVSVGQVPTINSQPRSQSVLAGQSATFSVTASGSGSLSYQWMKNGELISGATEAIYKTPAVGLSDQGNTFRVQVANDYGSTLSDPAVLSVAPDLVAPIVEAAETGSSGSITLSATATDNVGIIRLEFYVDGGLVGSCTNAPYRLGLDSTSLADASHLLVAKAYDPSGNVGTSPSVPFTIDNRTGTAPAISVHPADQTISEGQSATFQVMAGGSEPMAFQWSLQAPEAPDWVAIPGATSSSYATPPMALADGGTKYRVTLTNAYGSATSNPAILTVVPGAKIGALIWKRDIVYVGTREVGEIDTNGLHITQVDHLGSPRLLSDRNGVLEDEQKYLPFGQCLEGRQTSAKGFTNHEQTDASGLIYMQARFYAPWYGRFLSPDPARDQHFEETQSWNIYSYCQNNPTMKIDPTGMFTGDLESKLFQRDPNIDDHTVGRGGTVDKTNAAFAEARSIREPQVISNIAQVISQGKEAHREGKPTADADAATVKRYAEIQGIIQGTVPTVGGDFAYYVTRPVGSNVSHSFTAGITPIRIEQYTEIIGYTVRKDKDGKVMKDEKGRVIRDPVTRTSEVAYWTRAQVAEKKRQEREAAKKKKEDKK